MGISIAVVIELVHQNTDCTDIQLQQKWSTIVSSTMYAWHESVQISYGCCSWDTGAEILYLLRVGSSADLENFDVNHSWPGRRVNGDLLWSSCVDEWMDGQNRAPCELQFEKLCNCIWLFSKLLILLQAMHQSYKKILGFPSELHMTK